MARGAPDDSNVLAPPTSYRLDDMAELAARLGSLLIYDRGGSVVFLADFSAGLTRFDISGQAAGAVAQLTQEYCDSAGVCANLVGDSGTASPAQIGCYLRPLSVGNLGFAFAFSLGSDVQYVELFVSVWDGTTRFYYDVRYEHALGVVQYNKTTDGWTEFGISGILREAATLFHHMKLVVDTEEEEYLHLTINQTSYPMDDLLPRLQTTGVLPCIQIAISVCGTAGNDGELFVDNVVVTENEIH